MRKFFVAILCLLLSCSMMCSAHPGRTDKYGGHTNSATGEYHYHNPDGTITVAPKPEENSDKKTTKNEESSTNEITETDSQITNNVVSVVVDDEKKPVQESVKENIITETENNEIVTEADEIIKMTDKNGDTIIYVPKVSPYRNIHISIWIILIIMAIIGLCAISPIVCILLRKLESLNSSWSIIIHIPYLIFWLPSLAGKLLYTLYNRISHNKKEQNSIELDDNYEDDYEI